MPCRLPASRDSAYRPTARSFPAPTASASVRSPSATSSTRWKRASSARCSRLQKHCISISATPSRWHEKSLADPAEYLIVASSARALSAAARRSGAHAYALDLFGDADTVASTLANRVVAGDL